LIDDHIDTAKNHLANEKHVDGLGWLECALHILKNLINVFLAKVMQNAAPIDLMDAFYSGEHGSE
jgi:hypothetical protein